MKGVKQWYNGSGTLRLSQVKRYVFGLDMFNMRHGLQIYVDVRNNKCEMYNIESLYPTTPYSLGTL